MTGYFDTFDSWSKLGFILHDEFDGNSDGLDLFDKLIKKIIIKDIKQFDPSIYQTS